MRRTHASLVSVAAAGALLLSGCAGSDGDSSSSAGPNGADGADALRVGIAFDTGGRGDKSFNDSAFAGVQAALDTHGGEYQEVVPNSDGSDRADLLAQLADQGFDPVIAVGFPYADAIVEVAPQYPDTSFAIIDSSVADLGAENVTGLLFAANEGSFLGGVAAALKTETSHVGFVGGVETPVIESFEAGFVAGVQAVDPTIVVDRQYISPAGDFSGFSDPARGQIVAQGMYDAGADIVYAAAGGSGIGVFQAAAASGKRAIGVDSDQYETVGDPALQPVIMTSVLKRVDNAVEAYIGSYVDGDTAGGTDVVYDLASGGVGLATSGGFIDDVMAQIEEYQQKIVDGDITVPTAP